jgi:ATP-binding cassette subfamily F protein 3
VIEEQLTDTELYSENNKDKLKKILGQQAQLCQENDDIEEQWLALQEELELLEGEA